MEGPDTNRYAYNAQVVVDQEQGIVVACEVTRQETDVGQLAPMIARARANEASEETTVTTADRGYGAGADLQDAQQQGMNVLVPPAEGKKPNGNPYATQHFHYDGLPGAKPVHARPERPADRSATAHRRRATDASAA